MQLRSAKFSFKIKLPDLYFNHVTSAVSCSIAMDLFVRR